jgi:uncharacterized membrane protein YbhN (UPF0104 family)
MRRSRTILMRRFKTFLKWLFFVAVITLLVRYSRDIEWNQVRESVGRYHPFTIGLGMLLGLLCVSVYSCYDLVARRVFKLPLTVSQNLLVAFTSYAFNLNLGALVGGVAFRYRLYSRYGIEAATVSKVIGFSWLTNWLAYFFLSGVVFSSGLVKVPGNWEVGSTALRWIGAGFLGLFAAYTLLIVRRGGEELRLLKIQIALPRWRIACVQGLLGCAHWLLMGIILYLFMPDNLAFVEVFGVLLISAVAALLSHIPSGLGVLEAVFIALLGSRVPHSEIIAVLLVYRAVLYLFPLLFGLVGLARIELAARKRHQGGDT